MTTKNTNKVELIPEVMEVVNGQLRIVMTLDAPRPSSTGKTLVGASTGGGKPVVGGFQGKPVKVNLTAWVAK